MQKWLKKQRNQLIRTITGGRRFTRDTRGSVAVEMAFILPIFISMAFLSWDAGTVLTQYNRSLSNLYSLGDIVSTRTSDLTCDQLDNISDLVYESYAHGNWARRGRFENAFNDTGAPDFRISITMVEVIKLGNGAFRGEVEWEYVRAGRDARDPGQRFLIPDEMWVEGLRYVLVRGFIHLQPSINYLGIFDMNPGNDDRTDALFNTEHYFPLRFVPNLRLLEEPGDLYNDKCKG